MTQLRDSQRRWDAAKDSHTIRNDSFSTVSDHVGADSIVVEGCVFWHFNCGSSRWVRTKFFDCSFNSSFFHDASFLECCFIRCEFRECGLAGVHFDDKCQFDNCAIQSSDLCNARLRVTDPSALRIQTTRLLGTQITGHKFFTQFFPEYVCDEIRLGKQATVYLARRCDNEHEVAIKVLDQVFSDASTSTRTHLHERERDNIEYVDSPYVPHLLDYDLSASSPYLVLERCRGRPLSDWIAFGERFEEPHRRELFRESFAGLDNLQHQSRGRCLLLRDIAPKNVIVNRESASVAWKFIDLGLSKLVAGASDRASMIAGTPLTMAPEVIRGAGDSTRSEMFSLGVTLAWTITGLHPYGETLLKKKRLRCIKRGPRLPGIAEPYLGILQRCLKYDPHDRFCDPRDVLTML